MNLVTIIAEKVHVLPIVKKSKVLAYLEDLESEETKSVCFLLALT